MATPSGRGPSMALSAASRRAVPSAEAATARETVWPCDVGDSILWPLASYSFVIGLAYRTGSGLGTSAAVAPPVRTYSVVALIATRK